MVLGRTTHTSSVSQLWLAHATVDQKRVTYRKYALHEDSQWEAKIETTPHAASHQRVRARLLWKKKRLLTYSFMCMNVYMHKCVAESAIKDRPPVLCLSHIQISFQPPSTLLINLSLSLSLNRSFLISLLIYLFSLSLSLFLVLFLFLSFPLSLSVLTFQAVKVLTKFDD